MEIANVRPISPLLVTDDQIMSQLRLTVETEQQYWQDLIDACTAYAEEALDSSLLVRTITGVAHRPNVFHPMGASPYQFANWFFLPRGPIQSITSAVDNNGKSLTPIYRSFGMGDYVVFADQSFESPLTIAYVAGYGSNITDVPADIRMAIRTHVAHLFERRESADEKQILAVPMSLQAFYSQRRRTTPVG